MAAVLPRVRISRLVAHTSSISGYICKGAFAVRRQSADFRLPTVGIFESEQTAFFASFARFRGLVGSQRSELGVENVCSFGSSS